MRAPFLATHITRRARTLAHPCDARDRGQHTAPHPLARSQPPHFDKDLDTQLQTIRTGAPPFPRKSFGTLSRDGLAFLKRLLEPDAAKRMRIDEVRREDRAAPPPRTLPRTPPRVRTFPPPHACQG